MIAISCASFGSTYLSNTGSVLVSAEDVRDYAIFMLDPTGQVTSWNQGAERIKGYKASEIIGKHFSSFYTEEDKAAGIPGRALKTAQEQGRFEAEGWRVRKDGQRFWASVVIDAIHHDGHLIGFAKITRDLTERRESQLHLEETQRQLLQLQKMEAVGQLTGGIAHDFNNILTGITGSLELASIRIQQGRIGDLARYISAAHNAASRAAALTRRLLAFSRRQNLEAKPTDANRLIANMEELIRRTVGPGIRVETVLAIGLWQVICDSNQLENAVLNLCINSRDAMPDGSSITVETSNTWLDEAGPRQRDMQPGQYVAICVTDTGGGMTEDVKERAFDPFFTTKPQGQGTGLGLSMVYGFAKQAGGQARIYSEAGNGTSVHVYLPRHTGALAAGDAETATAVVARAEAGETVLIIDDEPTIRILISESLHDLGYIAIEAADGSSGLGILQSSARIDLLITDIGLPGRLNGRQLAGQARRSRPDLKVLFITGYPINAAISNGHLEPGMAVLTKPFAIDTLASKIKAIMEQDQLGPAYV
jgi:PAS domain S-box-containing protein